MHSSPRLFRTTRYLLLALLLVVYVVPYIREHSSEAREKYAEILRGFQDEKKLFIADFLGAAEIDGDLDGSELAALCRSKKWIPDDQAVIVSCEPAPGGLGVVKSAALGCIRFAIEIGAQLILPRIALRSPGDVSNLHGGQSSKGVSLEYLFSLPPLVAALNKHCPQLEVHDSLDALYDRPSLLKPLDVAIQDVSDVFVSEGLTPTTILADTTALQGQFIEFINSHLPADKRHYPVRVNLANSVFNWPARSDTSDDFGKLLRVRDDVRALAASALYNLAKGQSLPLGKGAAQARGGYVGVHLRTEKDARDDFSYFPGYEDQSSYFLSYLASLGPDSNGGNRIVYLATGLTGADEDVKRFRASAADRNATVLLKRDLLGADEVAALNRLTWDQRALVDYEILLRADTMLGIVESSFAWDVALRRESLGGQRASASSSSSSAFVAMPAGVPPGSLGEAEGEAEPLMMWKDGYSRLFGKADRAISMYLGTWP